MEKSLKLQYILHLMYKNYEIASIKSYLLKAFQKYQIQLTKIMSITIQRFTLHLSPIHILVYVNGFNININFYNIFTSMAFTRYCYSLIHMHLITNI